VRQYLSLWREMFVLSWRRMPKFTAGALLALAGSVVVTVGVAVALRAAVDAAVRGVASAAAVAALLAALAYAANMVLRDLNETLVRTTSDRVGRLELHPEIYRDVTTIEGLEHLERPEYLDRLAVVRVAPTRMPGAMWLSVSVLANILRIVLSTLLLATINPWLLVLVVFAVVPVWLDQRGQRVVRRVEVETAEAFRLQQQLFDLTVDAGSGKELRVSGNSKDVVSRLERAWQDAMGRRFRAQVTAAAWKAGGWAVFVVGFVGGLGLIAYQTAHGQGSLGDIVLAVVVTANLRPTVAAAVDSMSLTSMAAGRIVGPYLWLRRYAADDRARRAATAAPPEAMRSGITLENVSYTYPGAATAALSGISAQLPAGTVVAVVGEYGSGKTTLVKLLSKFYRPDAGRILIDDTDLSEVETEAWRARSSAAYQDFGRFHIPFRETVGLGDISHLDDDERIMEAVRVADAGELVARLPQGLHTQLGTEFDGVDLSEGQWQRTALARAAMREDLLLFVLDEPTASLDAPSERAIFERYMERAREVTRRTGGVSVVVSHRFGTVRNADLILVLDHGRLVEMGSHQDLIDRSGRYAELFRMQAEAYA
jgi:ATP-binding cassette subfamily B protein